MKSYPSVRQLQYLKALAETGSFVKAAGLMLVSQPTLSAGIAALEETLGQSVVIREIRSISLTPFGREVYESACVLLMELDRLTQRGQYLDKPLHGPLRLGVIPTIAPYLLPALLPKLQTQFPYLEIEITENLSQILIEKTAQHQLDLALMAFPYDTPGLEQHTLYREDFYLARPNTGPAQSERVKISDLNPEDLLLLEEGHCLSMHALSFCDPKFNTQRRSFSAVSLSTLLELVQSGYGATLIPEMVTKSGAYPAGVEIMPFSGPKPGRDIGLAWRENNPRRAAFLEIAQHIKKPAPK